MSRAGELCQVLDGILKEEELTDERRADVEGVKKAMELLAFKGAADPSDFKTFPTGEGAQLAPIIPTSVVFNGA